MSIPVNLDKILKEQKITLTELSERISITLANLSILKTGKAKAIRFSTLDAICDELCCQPGDILVYEPDRTGLDPPGTEELTNAKRTAGLPL